MVEYYASLWGCWLVMVTIIIQAFVGNISKARLGNSVPGKIDHSLGHESFVFRSYRTLQNSLENLPLFIGSALLALITGVDPVALALSIWVYALARIGHMVMYYLISTDKNPSPRSYFYLIAVFANISILVLIAIALLA